MNRRGFLKGILGGGLVGAAGGLVVAEKVDNPPLDEKAEKLREQSPTHTLSAQHQAFLDQHKTENRVARAKQGAMVGAVVGVGWAAQKTPEERAYRDAELRQINEQQQQLIDDVQRREHERQIGLRGKR